MKEEKLNGQFRSTQEVSIALTSVKATILLQVIYLILHKCDRLKLTNERDSFLEELFKEEGYIRSPVNDAFIYNDSGKGRYFDESLLRYFFEKAGYSKTGLDYVRTYN